MVEPEKWATMKDWPVVYHGSSPASIARILEDSLRGPDGGQVAHGQAGSSSGKTIYLSPEIDVANHPVYSADRSLFGDLATRVVERQKEQFFIITQGDQRHNASFLHQ